MLRCLWEFPGHSGALLEAPGLSFSPLGGSLGRFWPHLGYLCSHLVNFESNFGPPGPPPTLKNHAGAYTGARFSKNQDFPLELLLGVLFSSLEGVSGPFWEALGHSWSSLGRSWGGLGRLLGALGALLGC